MKFISAKTELPKKPYKNKNFLVFRDFTKRWYVVNFMKCRNDSLWFDVRTDIGFPISPNDWWVEIPKEPKGK